MRKILSIIVLFSFVVAKPASLTGIIYDNSDNSPLPGVIVTIQGHSQAFVSSESGSFSIKNLKGGTYTLKFSSIGYRESIQNVNISSNNDSTLSIGLSPAIEDLDAVVITGTRTEKRLKDVPVLTQVIHPNRLQEIGLTTVNAALEHEVPGLNLASFSYRPKVSFQGMNAKYVLFLVDGERIAGEMDGDVDYSRLNLDNVERIEVVRGASSALYGSNAIGGVINIITKKQEAALDGSAHVRYSANNELASGISLGFKQGKLSSRTGFSFNQTDGYLIPGDTIRSKTQEKMKNASVNQKFIFAFNEKFSITANGSLFYNRVFDGTFIPADHAYAGIGGYVKANYKLNNNTSIELTQVADNYSAYNVYFKNNDKHTKYSSDYQQSSRLIGNFSSKLGLIIAGLEYKPEETYSIRVNDSTKKAWERIAFVQDDIVFNEHFSVVAGARATQHSQYGFNFVPKVSAMARFQALVLRASYGKGFRSPTLKEMYYNFDHLGMFTLIGNPDLKPEKSDYTGFSLELNHNKNNFSINLYRNDVRDMIANKWIEPKVGQYINYETATIMGLDVLEKFIPFKNLFISTGISLVDARNNVTDLPLYGSSPVSINGSIRYSFLVAKESASVELFGKYTGERTYEPVGEYTYVDEPMQLWKFTYTQQYKNHFFLSLGIDNIFNRIDPNSLGNTSPGRRYFVSLNYNFVKY